MATKKTLEISGMTVDPHIQARETMVSQVVTEYAEAMQAGDLFPQVDVYHDGETDWLADGFHRVEAAKRCGKATIDAVIHEGNRRDATLHSVGSNANHGLRRSNEDKRKAVMTLLEDEEWSQWSDREIARRCKVSPDTVNRLRREVILSDSDSMNQSRTFVHHKTGKPTTMDTTNIGQSKVSQQPIAFMSKDTTAPERQEKERSSLPIRQEAFLPAPAPDETDIETDDDDAPDTDGGPPTDVESISDWILTLHRQAWDFKNRYRARGVAEALTTQDFGKLEMIIEFLKGVELIYNDLHPTTGGDWMSRFVQRVKQEAKE